MFLLHEDLEGSLLADLPFTLQGQRSYYYGEQVHGRIRNMQKVQKKCDRRSIVPDMNN